MMAARTSWGRRLLGATLAAYAAGYAVEMALGQWDPRRVGWGSSYLPVAAEGAVFAFLLQGVWGVVLAPLPLLLAPETWARVARLWDLVGPAGWLLLTQPLPVMWLAGVVGAGIRRLFPWVSGG